MSFLASIGSAVASVASTIFGIGKTVVSGLNISGIVNAVSGIASSVTGTLNTVINSGLGQAFTAVTDVVKGLDSVVTDVQSTVSGVINPIESFVKETSGLVSHINDGLVKPIESFVSGTNNLVHGLSTDFQQIANEGIKGLGSFVTNLSNTLSGTEAQFARATQQLGIQNTAIANDILGPAISDAGRPGFDLIHGVLSEKLSNSYKSVATFQRVSLASEQVLSKYDQELAQWADRLNEGSGLAGEVGKLLYDLVNLGPFLIASTGAARTAYEQQVAADNPTELLGLGDLIKALYRGILTQAEVQAEAAKQGVDPTRLQTLIENALWLPSVREALEFYYRGVLGETTLEQILEELGLTSSYAAAAKAAFLTPLGPDLWAKAQSRIDAANGGFLRESFLGDPPTLYKQTFAQRFLEEAQIPFAWAQHWNVPQMDWWITAYNKGFRTLSEVKLAAQADNIPPEVVDDLVEVFNETIQLWMVPDMLAQGVFNEAEAREYLRYIGMDSKSIDPIIKYGFLKTKAPAAAQAADLSKISVGNADTMFKDGIINQDTYKEVLIEHGYSSDAADLTVQLAVVQQQLTARTNTAKAIVKAVDVGQLTQEDAQSQLYALGYTDTEVANYVSQMVENQVAKIKTPSRADIEAFFKAGLMTETDALSALTTEGWSEALASMFLQLWTPKTTPAS